MTIQRVFFLNRLRPGVDPTAYERWVREVDYPAARSLGPVASYSVVRLEGHLRDAEAALPFDYLEVVEISDREEYLSALDAMPGREAFIAELRSFTMDTIALRGTVVE